MTDVIITDHALVRWLERAHGIEMEAHRAKLAEVARPFAKIGAMHAEVGGLWLVFDGPKLVTVTPENPARDRPPGMTATSPTARMRATMKNHTGNGGNGGAGNECSNLGA